jgi:mannitol/fructose-specific phosphotransferase system IIA component
MPPLLVTSGIHFGATASSKQEAVALCGSALQSLGAISKEYADAMWEREQIASSYLGNFVAMPHGTDESRKYVHFGQIVFIRFAQPFIWDDEEVKLCIGIAAQGDEHVEIIGNLADALLDEEKFEVLLATNDPEDVLTILNTSHTQ